MRPRDRSSEQPHWWRYLRFWGPNLAEDVDDELSFHLEMLVEENLARGMSPDAARRQALERFGNLKVVQRDCRRMG